MCGIVCAFDFTRDLSGLRTTILDMSKKIRHRGPDWNGIFSSKHSLLAHERLTIVDTVSGQQPLFSPDNKLILAANGEIYNHSSFRNSKYDFQTNSDCEVILSLYKEHQHKFLNLLNGIFAFALYDDENQDFLIARDHLGIIPLYMGRDENNTLFVASELKALEGYCNKIEIFPPGHYLTKSDDAPVSWYHPTWSNYHQVKENKTDISAIRDALEAAVQRQLMSDVPYGVLLSGGLDSSIISAIAKRYAKKRIESGSKSDAWWPQLHSFAVGLKGSPDLEAARKVAKHIDTVHHEIIFTLQEGLDALSDVIYHLETYDVTTVRASTPMYLMARKIRSMGIKMVLSGEGADEIFGGYLYFHKAPNAKEFHEETVRKLNKLHYYDCLRANKSMAAWSIEARVPFLDKEFIDVAMSIDPEDKMIKNGKIEKWVLRKAFEEYLPKEVAWRQKEQFSDGVGYSWIDTLKTFVEEKITDEEMKECAKRFPTNTPKTKEEYYYRSLFEKNFPSEAAINTVWSVPSIACSTPEALAWDESFKNVNDPSGRAINNVHIESY